MEGGIGERKLWEVEKGGAQSMKGCANRPSTKQQAASSQVACKKPELSESKSLAPANADFIASLEPPKATSTALILNEIVSPSDPRLPDSGSDSCKSTLTPSSRSNFATAFSSGPNLQGGTHADGKGEKDAACDAREGNGAGGSAGGSDRLASGDEPAKAPLEEYGAVVSAEEDDRPAVTDMQAEPPAEGNAAFGSAEGNDRLATGDMSTDPPFEAGHAQAAEGVGDGAGGNPAAGARGEEARGGGGGEAALEAPNLEGEGLAAGGQGVVEQEARGSVPPMELLERYRRRVTALKAMKQAKPDMVAFREMRSLTPEGVVGALPGVDPGLVVEGKGELAILGIHCAIVAGIYCKIGKPAFAVVLSGGYADDADAGAEFWYTGMGGQEKGVQVRDQEWKTSGNAALRLSHDTKSPVRVARQKKLTKGKTCPMFVYEGLYTITEAKMEAGTHGCQVCRYRFVAIPGEATVSHQVPVMKRSFKKVSLASEKPRKPAPATSAATAGRKRKAHTAHACKELMEDFSRGVESRKIPVFGAEDDAALIPSLDDFTYVRTSVLKPGEAEAVAELGRATFSWGDRCGVEAMGEAKMLVGQKQRPELKQTLEWGYFECGPSCSQACCNASRILARGVSLPLEIFKTESNGWGLRCSADIPIGTFICEYAGEIVTDSEAHEERSHEYLFDLDHFILLNVEGTEWFTPMHQRPFHPRLPPDLGERAEQGKDTKLVIDGDKKGNVGRFINHSCDGNLVVQPVFVQGSSALHYRVAMFAFRKIPAFEELTYSYNWSPAKDAAATEGVYCNCGAENCQGRLL